MNQEANKAERKKRRKRIEKAKSKMEIVDDMDDALKHEENIEDEHAENSEIET